MPHRSSSKHKHSKYKPPTSSDQMQANNEVILNQISQLEKQLHDQGVNDTLSELQYEIDVMRTTINEEDEEEALNYNISDYTYHGSVVEHPRAICFKQVNIAFLSQEYLQQIKSNLDGVKLFLSGNLIVQYLILLILLLTSSVAKGVEEAKEEVVESSLSSSSNNDISFDKSKLLTFYSPVIGLITLTLILRIGSLYFLTHNNLKKYAFQAFGLHMVSWLLWILVLLFSFGAFFMVLFVAILTANAPSYFALIFLTVWAIHRPPHQQVDLSLHLCSYLSSFQRFYRSFPALFLFYPRPLPRFSPRTRIQIYLYFYLNSHSISSPSSERDIAVHSEEL